MPLGFDEVKIANMALSKVGSKSTVEDLGAQDNLSKVCNLWYDAARIAALETHNWTFARKRVKLAAHNEPRPFEWLFRYRVPDDWIASREIVNPAGPDADPIAFDMEYADDGTMSLLTNMEEATLIYTFNQTNTDVMTIHFIEMVATKLGEKINPKVTGKVSIATRLANEFTQLTINAPNSDVYNHQPREERDASWIRART